MQIFINDLSIHGQYFSDKDFVDSISVLISIFTLINEKVMNREIYKDNLFLNREAIYNENFQASFQRIKDRSKKDAFRNIIFNKLNAQDWRLNQKHSSEDYFIYQYEEKLELVTDTALAEAAERVMCDHKILCLIVNFFNSNFKNCKSLNICKNDQKDNAVDLDCLDNKHTLELWLEHKLELSYTEYDLNSKYPPLDRQTVLRDTEKFIKTHYKVQGRVTYREVETNQIWYVDNMHYGLKSHIEVFNAGIHIGEADIKSGIIDFTKADSTKRFEY